jgi:hypothetical protein
MAKTLEELLVAETVTLPTYLVVKTDANEFRHVKHGQEVFHVVGNKVYSMANDKNGKLADNKVVISVEDTRVDYIASQNKDPYNGLVNPVSVAIEADADKKRALLQAFKEFVKGRFEFGVIVYETEVVESEGDVVAPINVSATPGSESVEVAGE